MNSFVPALLAFMAGIFPTIVADVETPDLRYLKAYPEISNYGGFEYFLDYVPDLSVYFLDDLIKSICYTGSWLLYSEANYEGTLLGNFSDIDNCRNLPLASMDETSSLRYAGSPYGLDDNYYNLYEGIGYTGAEFKGNTNAQTLGALDSDVSSLILSGQSSWTFFTGPQYTGASICLYPYNGTIGNNGFEISYFAAYSLDLIYLPDNSIRSVARGCLSERIVRLPRSEISLRPEGDHKLTNNVH